MAKFQPAPIFSDYMVLQRGKNLTIFGTGEEGDEIIGELAGFRASGIVRNGKWKLVFPPMGAARYLRLKLSDADNDEVIRYDNVAIGEVWFVSGNGAMDFGSDETSENCSEETESDIRFFKAGSWKAFSEGNNSICGVFAKKLSEYHDAAVGIVAAADAENIAPFTVSGGVYYCDDISAEDGDSYFETLVRKLIIRRELWNDDSLAFVIGQLPLEGFISEKASIVREAQMRVFDNLRRTGIAVLLDCGENDSEKAGGRFAAQAINLVYGGYDGAFAPTIKGAVWRGDIVELHFDNALGGFKMASDADGFEICGDDGVYYPAFADISGERIFLSSDDVAHPRGVRYLWGKSAENFVKNGFGLPLAPFRLTID